MTAAPTSLTAPIGRIRPDDLVRLSGSPAIYRVTSLGHRAGTVTLAHMSGKPAGTWDAEMVRAACQVENGKQATWQQ